jgi:tetratricopeptide (TPR) repeat protein
MVSLSGVISYMTDAIDYNNHAYKMQKQGNYAEAIRFYKKAVEVKEKAVGPNDYRVCISLSGLADAYLSLRDYDNAMIEAQRMKRIAESSGNDEQIRIANEIIRDINAVQ